MNPLGRKESFQKPIEYQETVLLVLTGNNASLATITSGKRFYFTNVLKHQGKRLVAVSVPPLYSNNGTYYFEGYMILAANKHFVLTLVNTSGQTMVLQYPISDLTNIDGTQTIIPGGSFGKTRRFDIENIDLQKSYVTYCDDNNSSIAGLNFGLLFNFFTED